MRKNRKKARGGAKALAEKSPCETDRISGWKPAQKEGLVGIIQNFKEFHRSLLCRPR